METALFQLAPKSALIRRGRFTPHSGLSGAHSTPYEKTECQLKCKYELDAIYRPGILGHLSIGRQERYALDHGLGDEEAIEGIFMDWRQGTDGYRMLTEDRQLMVAVVQEAPSQYACIHLEIFAPQAAFDNDFPQTGGAEE